MLRLLRASHTDRNLHRGGPDNRVSTHTKLHKQAIHVTPACRYPRYPYTGRGIRCEARFREIRHTFNPGNVPANSPQCSASRSMEEAEACSKFYFLCNTLASTPANTVPRNTNNTKGKGESIEDRPFTLPLLLRTSLRGPRRKFVPGKLIEIASA